ncbi:Large exoprotein containing haemagglutination activity domain [Beggiatoa sp. PS]|nr:Large exoprotein containing haemagglutination activity domain [Beggiatoa sp. PS]
MLNWQQWVTVGMTLACMMVGIPTQAQISTDGTVGPAAQPLEGPNYKIGDNLGQRLEGNLFHSFQDFNLNSGQTATFTAPESLTIQNVISRVTGGNPSNIDGAIISDISGADFYFLNPFGIVFGKNASLDVQGSFHASTADYLRLGNGGIFHARNPSESLLTVAPIESFGFLGNSVASITIQGSHLEMDEHETLSVIGGDLEITDSTLFSPGGKINLVSVAQAGEIVSTFPNNAVESFEN